MYTEGLKFQVASLGMSIVALGTFLIVDWYLPATTIVDPAAIPLVGIGALCLAWSAPLTSLAGRSYFPEFNFFQPFVGSQIFQLHQALGWTLYGLCLLAISFTVVDIKNGRHPRGETTLIGVIGLVSQLLLSGSLTLYSPSVVKVQRKQKHAEYEIDLLKRTTLIQNPMTKLSIGLTIISTILLIRADDLIEASSTILFVRLATAGHLSAAFITHILIGVQKIPHYRVFMPFSGGFAFLLLQAFGWILIGIFTNISILFPSVLRYGVVSTGKKLAALGVAAQCLILISLLYFRHTSRDSNNRVSDSDNAIHFSEFSNFRSIRFLIQTKGSSTFIFSACLLPWSVILLVAVRILGEEVSDAYFGGKNTMSVVSICIMLFTAPLAHLSGLKMYNTYELFQPFEGGSTYATAQSVGWTAYSISLSLWLVYNLDAIDNNDITFSDAITGLVPLGFLSSCLLIGSVLYYVEKDERDGNDGKDEKNEKNEKSGTNGSKRKRSTSSKKNRDVQKSLMPPLNLNTSTTTRKRRSARLRAISKGREKKKKPNIDEEENDNNHNNNYETSLLIPWHGHTWSNEEYLTFYIACGNQILCVATDMARQDKNRIVSPIVFFWMSYFGVLLVPFLFMMAGRKRWDKFKIFQPFVGGTMFVAWQALGWTLYSTGFLLHSVLLAIPEDLWSGNRIREWPLMFTLAGIPSFIAHCILIISVAKFVPTSSSSNGKGTTQIKTSPPCSPIHSPLHSSNRNQTFEDTKKEIETNETTRAKGRERASIVAQIVSIILAFASIVLIVLSDVQQHIKTAYINEKGVTTNNTTYVLFVCGCIAAVFGALFTHGVAGVLLHPPGIYKFVQVHKMYTADSFQGGVAYILLQTFGWWVIGCSVVGGMMIVEIGGPTKTPFFGITSALGAMLFVGQITILASLRWWHEDDNEVENESDENNDHDENENNNISENLAFENRAVLRSAIMSVTLCVGGLSLFTFADYAMLTFGPEFPTGPLIVCGIVAVCGSVPLSWLLSGSSSSSSLSSSSSISNDHEHTAKHQVTLFGTFGWALWSFTVMLGAWTLLNMATMNTTNDDEISSLVLDSSPVSSSEIIHHDIVSINDSTRSSRIASIIGIVAQSILALGVLKPPAAAASKTDQNGHHLKMGYCNICTNTFITLFRGTISIIGPTTSIVLVLLLVLRNHILTSYYWLVSIFGWNVVAATVVFLSLILFPTVTSPTIRGWMKKNALLIWFQYLNTPIGIGVTFLGYWFILPSLRIWLDYVAWLYHYWWFHYGSGHVSQDGLPVRQNCNIERKKRYGTLKHEFLSIYTPIKYDVEDESESENENEEDDKFNYGHVCDRGPLIFVHGGGWVAVNREVMGQSITPFVRAGFTVYSIDYPLAPECKFPGPLISVLRACAWVKRHSGCHEITIVGDSAGGNLSTMAAALISNPKLLIDLEECASYLKIHLHESLLISEWNYPSIKSIVSMYGVVDQKAWKAPYRCIVPTFGQFQEELLEETWIMWIMWEGTIKCLQFCFDCYAPVVPESLELSESRSPPPFINYLTLGDLCENNLIRHYPPTLLICGVGDPLVLANRKVRDLLSNSGCCSYVKLLEFPGPHAFHGIPPQWTFDGWRSNSYPTTRAMLMFVTDSAIELPMDTIFLPPDWSLYLVFIAHVVIVVGLILQTIEIVLLSVFSE